ncbi:ABC transporter ATP-binding protein [Maridesulfovibrio zosterae]|uniref:ABC transporter ATP-binding protein n=1 Tax=Maridesulfovibrio zosterae TaxID=82171 RepID=UPI000411A8A4|nr:ABC transporter ATP-binding protein [Maridesulfovibrio zosterae]
MSTVISLTGVSKKYRLFRSPKERLKEVFHPFKKQYHTEFWALRDIELSIEKGSTVGLVGRNGAGKSTLLQILCSVLSPTTGDVHVHGRISAILELGAGFNPEFSGRENVILNGKVMGFSSAEMLERVQLIKAFAEIGDFFDQPVKTYSSGMFVRLAFASAISVDPDILIVDEALAVGDAKFQHKCYAKFKEFQKAGKTIVFVSHNLDSVTRHCDSAFLLEKGRIVDRGEPKSVMNCYLDMVFSGELKGFVEKPVSLGEEYKAFEFVRYKKGCVAIPKHLIPDGVEGMDTKPFEELIGNELCLSGNSKEELVKSIDRAEVFCEQELAERRGQDELRDFMTCRDGADCCSERRQYHSNEYRYGNGKAAVVDFLIVADGVPSPPCIQAGSEMELYVKIAFFEPVDAPMTGFAFKSTDGVDVFGTSSKNLQVDLEPVGSIPAKGALERVFKWTVPMKLAAGDYFLDLGCGEYFNGESSPLDRRYGIAHIQIQSDAMYAGFVDLAPAFEVV